MNKRPIDLGETNPFRIPADEQAAQTSESSYSEGRSTGLGVDMLPGSQALPSSVNILHRLNFKILTGIFFGLLIIGLVVYYMTGFGRSTLEKSIIGLIGSEKISTESDVTTNFNIIKNPPEPSKTQKSSPTPLPTLTKVVAYIAMPTTSSPTFTTTHEPTLTPKASVTPTPACWDVNSISLADVGQTRCVRGTVIETIAKATNFLLIFSNKKGALYWISYDMVWTSDEVGNCYQVTGRIDELGNNPVLIFDYSNIPIVCP